MKLNNDDLRKYINLGYKIPNIEDMAKIQEKGILMANHILESNEAVMIADDVGLGKTYEGLGLAFYRNIFKSKNKSNILIIAPNYYVAKKWIENEYQKFTNKCLEKSIDDVILYNEENKDLINNPLELIKLKNKYKDKHVISIIRINCFSFINANNFKNIKNVKLPSYNRDNDDEYEAYVEAISNELINLNSELPDFDLVMIDESQNLRGTGSLKVKFFSAFFGLYYIKNNNIRNEMKFKKTVFLTATPYHSTEKDVFIQMSFVKKEKKEKIDIINSPKDLNKKIDKDTIYIIKRSRMYKGKSKFYYRTYEALKSHTKFHENLTMALIQKAEIAKNGYIFRMGTLDGFERFYKDTLNDKKGEIPNENEMVPDRADKIDTYLLDNFEKDLKKKFKNEENKFLTHPKPREIKNIISKKNHDYTEIDKTLIFVRIKSTIKDIEKVLVREYDNTLTELINDIIPIVNNPTKKAIKNFENQLKSNYNKDIEDRENTNESEEKNSYENTDKKKRIIEPYESLWLKKLRVKPTNNTILPNQKKRFLNYNKFDEFFEEDYFKLLGFKIKNMSYQNNELKVTFEKNDKSFPLNITIEDIKNALKKKKVSISNKKLKRLTRKRIINLILLQKLADEKLIPEYISKEYEAFYFEKGTNNNNFNIDLDDLPKLFTDNPSIWDSKYFNLNQLMYNNNNIDFDNQEKFLKREFIKYIIKSNIINSESILYFIALVCNLEKNNKDIDYRDILNEIDKNNRFWKRIYNRVREFFSSFNSDIDTLLNHLGYSSFYQNKELDSKKIQEMLNKRQFCKDSIVGCSSNNDEDNVYNKSIWFNTSFYPDIIIATDIVKEGIDLQRNCSHIIHYGIAWTPGDMEQRIGRIDRYFCKAYRAEDPKVRITFIYIDNTIDERQIENITSKMIKAIKTYNKNVIENILVTKKDTEVDISKEDESIENNINILTSIKD